MGTLRADGLDFDYQWASDVAFAGIRLEVLDGQGDVLFDVSVPDQGTATVNTFSREVPVELVMAAMAIAEQRR